MGIVITKPRGSKQFPTTNLAQMWDKIESWSSDKSCDHCNHPSSQGWETVRVFVSSTFDDFHSEREVLVKQVFLELREWCETRGLCLAECDLRWGIPQDTPSGKILTTCLGELDRCCQDTYNKPLMVILLGERFGWIPDIDDVPQGVVELFSWVPGMSVTGMEILYGAYRTSNPNAAFCLRDPSFLKQLHQHDLLRYQEKGRKALLLQSLKKRVCQRFPAEQILRYKCQVVGTSSTTGTEKVRLDFSNDFSSWILQFLQKRILQTYPGHSEPISEREGPSWMQSEAAQHQLLLQQKSQLFIGRELEVQKVLDFLKLNIWEKHMLDKTRNLHIPLYQITAEPGMGKSALLAACITRACELPTCTVFYHFIGCSPSSVQLNNIVMRLCCHLISDGSAREDVLMKLRNCGINDEMKEILRPLLVSAAGPPDTIFCIFIDAINQLSNPSDASDLLSWLSTEEFLAPSFRCVISSIPNAASSNVGFPYYLNLEPLSQDSARSLAVIYLSRYSKILSPEQLDLLIQNTSSMNPLWLSLACEELRVFGVFETLTKKIVGFPNTLQGLLGSIIQRLVLEDQVDKVKELLCLLYCCPEGVAEGDLRGALSELEGGAKLPSMHWATLRRTLSCLLRVGRDHRGRDTLGFFHGSVAKAVEQCFLGSDGARQPYLCSLADYYESRCTDDFSVVLQVPRLLREAKLHARLVQFLRKDRRALSIPAHTRVQYLKPLRCSHVCRDGFPRSPAVICFPCSLRTGAFGQLFLNKQSCALCGASVMVMGKEAFLCLQHSRQGFRECLVCRSPILGPQTPSPALLCHLCGFFQTCVTINI